MGGIGLGRFSPWAWYLGIIVLVPFYLVGGLLGVLLVGTGIINATSIALILSAVYVAWVLLSKGGHSRYARIRAALEQANTEHGTMLSKYYGKKRTRGARRSGGTSQR